MREVLWVVVSVGIADSLNPTTILTALVLAARDRPRGHLIAFSAAVFAVYLAGGILIVLGPGQLLLDRLPNPSRRAGHVVAIVLGVAMLTAAVLVWQRRTRLSSRFPSVAGTRPRSSAILGATVTLLELPTAFPYFVAIAAIVESGVGPARQVLLVTIFNVCFVLPLVTILAILTAAGQRAQRLLAATRLTVEHRWPLPVAGLALLGGIAVLAFGIGGLIGDTTF
jgi:cytochrome c biogenesis protein CcdA